MLKKITCILTTSAILWLMSYELNANPAQDNITKDNRPPVRTLEWNDLIPAEFNPDRLVEKYQQKYNIDQLPDDDLRVEELMQRLEELEKLSPVNNSLNGNRIRLPGYVVPLETDGTSSSEFLLVPYFGACIHVPPPPLNQTVYVRVKNGNRATIRNLFDIVWVTGIMRVEKLSTELAEAGYIIDATEIVPYE
ncbi:DUF3299 domain-containing protein [Motiliproteus sp. MSK22-1]|uniref:DUF3299 domain-containing protein n=1 Tax=Motiliproteus sp. MSK22-1 TaxID=1897630 RepID=UPI0009761B08|nr:DUF3299 domain-containing protein [Motiliproteus sp. MSK22-1]OMH26635.1 hypothetical protein BGP75_23345 [Motiliproteus sp. MSK22-1]